MSAWLQHEAGNVVERTHAREQQIERLASLMAAPPPVAGGVLADFDGLFAGHRVAWQQTATGPVLVLRVRPDEVPR
ncbi:MAG: hypothetical protein Q7T30_04625 [Planctomycetota bacterium]|nr:hypothetical protein [Planctomycetota bacterium]